MTSEERQKVVDRIITERAEHKRRANIVRLQKSAAYMVNYYHNGGGKAKQRAYQHKAKYGVTLQERDDMLASQGGVCAGCLSNSPGPRDWHTDHCHATGNIRGILCHGCNTGLGNLKHDISTLTRLVGYLQRSLNV